MIDVTTKAGMDQIVKLHARHTIRYIIHAMNLAQTERNLQHRIKRYVRDGAVIYSRKGIPEERLRELAARGLCRAEAARAMRASPCQIQMAAKYYGIEFTIGNRGYAPKTEKPAPWTPPPSASIPKEVRRIISGRWANSDTPSRFLAGR